MRAAIISDIHYGDGEAHGKINPETGLHTRLEDIDAAVNYYVDYVIREKIDVAIIAGDVYKTRKPTPTQQMLFAKALARLLAESTDDLKKIIVIPGNHDIQLAETAHSTSSLGVLVSHYEQRLKITDQPEDFLIEHGDESLLITTIPYLYRQRLQMSSNQQVVELYTTIIKNSLSKYRSATHKMFIGHQTVEGTEFCEYIDINSFNEIVVPKDILNDFDAAFFGHIHKYQVLNPSAPLIVYQGNPLILNFGELETKGFVVYDSVSKTHDRVIIDGPTFRTIEVDASDANVDATQLITEKLKSAKLNNCIVKIKLVAKESDLPIRTREFAELLESARFFAGIEKQVQRKARVRDQRVHKDNNFENIVGALAETRQYTPATLSRYKELANSLKLQAENT